MDVTRQGAGITRPTRRLRRGSSLVVALLVGVLVLVSAPVAPAEGAPVATVVPYGLAPTFQGRIVAGPDGNLWFGTARGFGRVTPDGASTVFPVLPPEGVVYPSVSDPAPGPDGNVWFGIVGSLNTDGALARVTPAGQATYVTEPGQIRSPRSLALGPDGNVWFADATGAVGRVTPAGGVTRFATPNLVPSRITAGADGNVWFAAVGGSISRITPTGTITTFPASGFVTDMVAGPDGNVWYTVSVPGGGSVRRITPAGAISSFAGPQVNDARAITSGPDGALWFGNSNGTVGRATTAGSLSSFAAGAPKVAGISAGPDGNLWITAVTSTTDGSSSIVRMTTAGVPTVFTTMPLVRNPASITTGPDGSRWFLNGRDGSVGRITPTGEITLFAGDGTSNFGTITTGPDGNLWFTRPFWKQIVRMTPTGERTAFDVPGGQGTEVGGITSGPDGNLWFTQTIGDRIGRITPTGTITLFSGLGVRFPNQITAGPDGALWFTNENNTIGRITTEGQVTNFPGAGIADPRGITAGADGNLWFANFGGASIGRITPSGQVSTFTAPGLLRPEAITTGADGNVWFTNGFPSSTIGRATPSGAITTFRQVGIDEPIALAPGSDGRIWIANNGNVSISTIAVDDLPAAPTAVTAVAGQTEATVSWVPPATTGGTPIVSTTVTADPGGASCRTSTATTCTVTGLAPGTSYTFSVTARNATATSVASAPSNAVVPRRGSGYHPVPAVRILDSRLTNLGFTGKVEAGSPRSLHVAGLGGPSNVPMTASAVVMNVTVADPTAESFLTVYPTGRPQPNASNLNFGAGQIVPNLVTVKLGTGGRVEIANAVGATDVIADVVGYYDDGNGPGLRFNPVVPSRLLDSRTSTGGWDGPLVAGTPRDLDTVAPENPGGVYDGAASVIVNVTVTGGTHQSFVTLWEAGKPQPAVSNLNLLPGQTVANLAIVPLSAVDQQIRIANAVGSVHVIVDVVGYFDPNTGASFHAMDPTRVLDTRNGLGLAGPQDAGPSRSLAVAGAPGSGVPAGATGLVANLTVADGTAESFVAMFPGNQLRPVPFSNVNFGRNQVIPNLATVGLPPSGDVRLHNQVGSTAVILDAVGYYAAT